MTDINYNNKAQSLEVSVRIFTDDFEKTLRKNCNCRVDLLNPADKKTMEKIMNTYILQHLQLKLDGHLQTLEYSGFQQEDESTWNYFVVKNLGQFKKLEMNNTLLYDYRTEQINMVHIQANGKEQSDKLDYPESAYVIAF